MQPLPAIPVLREKIRRIEAHGRRAAGLLPFGVALLDEPLGGGLALAAVHDVAGFNGGHATRYNDLALAAVHDVAGGDGVEDHAAATLFAAGIMARLAGPVLWCLTRPDLFAPALAQAGLAPDQVIYAEARDETECLACFEEGLRHVGLAGTVAELGRVSMTQSRRLLLAAEAGGGLGLVLRRWRRPGDAASFTQPNAAATRWRVAAASSAPLPVLGIGRARWQVELLRSRGGATAKLIVEASNDQGRLALPAALADRAPGTDFRRRA